MNEKEKLTKKSFTFDDHMQPGDVTYSRSYLEVFFGEFELTQVHRKLIAEAGLTVASSAEVLLLAICVEKRDFIEVTLGKKCGRSSKGKFWELMKKSPCKMKHKTRTVMGRLNVKLP